MQCFGRTKNRSRCKNEASYIFCRHHKWQPISFVFSLVAILAVFGGFYQDTWKPILSYWLGSEKGKNESDTRGGEGGRQDEEKVLAEANRPILELESIELEYGLRRIEGHARFFLKNTGNTSARAICISISQTFDTNGEPIFAGSELMSTCDPKYATPLLNIRKNGELSLPLIELREIARRIGFIPSSAKVHRNQPKQNIFLFIVTYKDYTGAEYKDLFQFEFFENAESNR